MKRRALFIAIAAAATAVVVKLCKSKPRYYDPLPPDASHPPNTPTGPK